ncbi:hypothetical protein BOX15_Mlig008010g4 [Macrostomum lignano]|uniref:Caveolin n=2 Tax=Macrostomum lignano TaxID=282301 RepID=A0A1I8H2T4_9PLAT|nr:hypothetical protein BOX15_Mlig008010g3 [Macrostomum lignano]PAA52088.1 hypothetical protein BOX15_Mlig008010g2 [Macrostomum lignano]PAA69314.1 hypothetical protein BOX15_Mlig008010g1 [Macrostomum lignano]PAA75340.1 hypothetical protein BOX15_Mlig008010g4 [Macrostomum lignano]
MGRDNDSRRSDDSDLDMVNRDPNGLNAYLKVGFEDVLAEPDDAHSIDCVWRNSYRCYNGGKNCCYKLLTVLTGLCIALYWGCTFAIVAYNNIWCITPSMKLFKICTGVYRECCVSVTDCVCGPICRSFGLLFSRISVSNK